ncbi:MAG TPA: lysylphosphatidylglycerol synthase domain-containing protein, partial [Polyangia bacterium]|nr:lysylphosphatidylglycerol synthase domain-containing protein [Polyangia bacterium]
MRAVKPLLALAGLVLLGYMLSKLSLARLAGDLARVGPWALVTPLLAGGWLYGNAMALYVFLPSAVSKWGLWRNRFVSEGYNNILPLLGLGGEGFKVQHLARVIALDDAVTATLKERLVDSVLGLWQPAACVAIGAWLLPLPRAAHDAVIASAVGSFALGCVAVAAIFTPWPYRLAARAARLVERNAASEDGASAQTRERPQLGVRRTIIAIAWMLAGRVLGVGEIALIMWRLGQTPSLHALVEWIFLYGAFGVVGTIAWPVPGNIG